MMNPSPTVDPETGSGPTVAAVGDKKCATSSGSKMGKVAPLSLLFLAMFSGIAVYSHSNRLGKVDRKLEVTETAGELALTASGELPEVFKRRLDNDREGWELSKRMVAVLKETFPECVNNHMNGVSCKNFIDEEILTKFTGIDRMTRTIISGKRSIMDVFYNTVVIFMDDNDHVTGRDGDGMIYYDFDWVGSGRYVTKEEECEIPPIIATETEDGLYFENEPILVEGCTLADIQANNNTNPCAGGVVVDPNKPDKECPGQTFEERLDAALAITVVPAEGERQLPAFDCSCLTGFHCCLIIKASVRDADIYNKAIQCHLNYAEPSKKAELFHDGRGKVVNIYTNHNFVVSKVPHVEGSWPEGIE